MKSKPLAALIHRGGLGDAGAAAAQLTDPLAPEYELSTGGPDLPGLPACITLIPLSA
jgi:hypothetical protein